MTCENHPGGFHATRIRVYLYADGRTNFRMIRYEGDDGREAIADPVDQKQEAQAVSLQEVGVQGLDWHGIIETSYRIADQLRGCTWEQYCRRGRPSLRPEGEQLALF